MAGGKKKRCKKMGALTCCVRPPLCVYMHSWTSCRKKGLCCCCSERTRKLLGAKLFAAGSLPLRKRKKKKKKLFSHDRLLSPRGTDKTTFNFHQLKTLLLQFGCQTEDLPGFHIETFAQLKCPPRGCFFLRDKQSRVKRFVFFFHQTEASVS